MRVTVEGVQLQVTDLGSGQVVLLLHGFPDSARLWKDQIPALVESGYRVLAPDLKGFGLSDKPQDVQLYAMPNLLTDVLGILDQLHIRKVHCVVGHDWGAALAWQLAGRFPDRFERLAALSVGHNASMFGMGGNKQREKSWYMLFFKFKGISERALQRNDWALLRQLWFADDPQVATEYIAELSRPGALTAALNWYRANVQLEQFGDTKPRPAPLLRCPVMGIWSCGDQGVLEAQMKASARYVQDGMWRYHQIRNAGHWIPRDAPDELNHLLRDFLKSTSISKL
ncbi:hypothetical protein ABBQ32_006012 [Trebouxia sp. C0010 RCD-2024]